MCIIRYVGTIGNLADPVIELTTQLKNINREAPSSFDTHFTCSLMCALGERGRGGTKSCGRDIVLGLSYLCDKNILRKFVRFSPLWFP